VCGPIDDMKVNLPQAKPVTLRVARAAKVIGMPLTQAQCADALGRLGLAPTLGPVGPNGNDASVVGSTEGQGTITVTPPLYRFDLQIEEDLIEEVARLIGYDHLPHTPPQAPVTVQSRPEAQRPQFAVRRALAALGYQETINYSFVDERWEHELAGNAQPIKLLNPIASQMGVMRSSLLGSLLQVLKYNLDRKASRVRVFEVGRIFLRDASVKPSDTTVEGFDQPMRVAGMACGGAEDTQWGVKERAVDFYDLKGDVEALLAPLKPVFEAAEHPAMHPGRCARVLLDGQAIGFVGELHPRWRQAYGLAQAPVMFELALEAVMMRQVPAFQPVSRHQAVERDIAVIVNESVTHAALMAAIHAAPTEGLLRNAILFDVYRPRADAATGSLKPTEKSLAVRLTLHSSEATLTEAQIEQAVRCILDQLVAKLGARLRD
ncbi:MAG: phenylalanine--tRNA ligase subunit beta, partial [Hylemonella sp.]|nr:phenylalanine--tRNA ligase subunit beta [Hylemonella sp.]